MGSVLMVQYSCFLAVGILLAFVQLHGARKMTEGKKNQGKVFGEFGLNFLCWHTLLGATVLLEDVLNVLQPFLDMAFTEVGTVYTPEYTYVASPQWLFAKRQ